MVFSEERGVTVVKSISYCLTTNLKFFKFKVQALKEGIQCYLSRMVSKLPAVQYEIFFFLWDKFFAAFILSSKDKDGKKLRPQHVLGLSGYNAVCHSSEVCFKSKVTVIQKYCLRLRNQELPVTVSSHCMFTSKLLHGYIY